MSALSRVGRRPLFGFVGLFGLAVVWFLVSPLFVRGSLVEERSAVGQAAARGAFNEIDFVHKGRGQAIVERGADGRLTVRLEQFSVTNGPDLHVFLSRHAAPASDAEVKDGLLLGRLKAPEGAFSYTTEAPADPAEFRSVVVHCVAFRTIFSYATLGPP